MILHGPYSITAGQATPVLDLGSYPDTAAFVVLNESGMLISGQNSSGLQAFAVTAYCADAFLVPNGFSGALILNPISIFTNQIASAAPSSVVFIITYAEGESLTKALKGGLPTGYPMPLPRLSNIGNSLNTVASGASFIQNDGNATGTSIIEATPVGASGSTVSMDNNGNFFLKQWISSTLTQLFQVISNAANGADNVKLSDSAHQVHVLGTLLCDLAVTMSNNLAVTGTSTFTGDVTTSGQIHANATVNANGAGTSLFVANNESVSGNLAVTGTSAFTGDITTTGKIIANGVGTVVNGSVAGTVTFFTPIWGTALKILIVLTSTNYNDATSHVFVFPSAIIAGMFYIGNQGTTAVTFRNGATNQNVDTTATLGGSSAGTHNNITAIKSDSLGEYDSTTNADRINWNPGGAINNGVFIFIGA